jgi:hypothetical protein
MMNCYERMDRAAYLIIEGNLKAVADTIRSIEPLKNAGIVIQTLQRTSGRDHARLVTEQTSR